ncbi:ATPase [Virgisporangium aliadipatigenens]|uniref:ATPase n=1 Tax=Virgisporangium aliadipatigenens TaxID=741659 RepID=A0A8J3YKA3_9ACTN|nr:DUF87 domain-containing protein [Virgisporangium aliadipatigenens]GIJ46994.1 ATPase [Virgisporangium aliadipatigenens]
MSGGVVSDDLGLKALEGLRIHLAPSNEDIWDPSPFHVETLHRNVVHQVVAAIDDARKRIPSPTGVVVQGQRGSGKTHLLGWIRRQVQDRDGYFFVVSLLDGRRFWHSVAQAMVDGLNRTNGPDTTQLGLFLQRLTLFVGVPFAARQAVLGAEPLSKEALDMFAAALFKAQREVGRKCRDTARALVMLHSDDLRAVEIATTFLSSADECEPGERMAWGLPRGVKPPESVVSEISWLLAVTGPSVIAVDQIDGVLTPYVHAMEGGRGVEPQDAYVLDQIATVLMDLREATRKTVTVVALQPTSWQVIKSQAIAAVQDRFTEAKHLGQIPTPGVGRQLVAKRLRAHFDTVDFEPPYPTWPVREEAFDTAQDFRPRQLLQNVSRHISACVQDGVVREMTSLGSPEGDDLPLVPVRPVDDLGPLDRQYAELRRRPDVPTEIRPDNEDAELPRLLSAGLAAWIFERGDAGRLFEQDTPPSTKPPLHARLHKTLVEETEEQAHWAFRAITAGHHIAVQNRLRKACLESGLAEGVSRRRLFILRNGPWPGGQKTAEMVRAFEMAGGRKLAVGPEDLRILAALRDLIASKPADLQGWLVARRPTRELPFLREALAEALADLPGAPAAEPFVTESPAAEPLGAEARPAAPAPEAVTAAPEGGTVPPEARAVPPEAGTPTQGAAVDGMSTLERAATWGRHRTPESRTPSIRLGAGFDDAAPVAVDLEALRKHTAIFAGSGSGKTVLIRRLVEECALQGVSSIVLDPNNDLARLGDAWPQEPAAWGDGDARKSRDYLADVDVVVWTPRREAGRPISFQPLPDFHSFVDDPDEFEAAVEAALAALAPRAKVTGNTAKADRARAVLKEALVHYGRSHRETTLRGFIGMLNDLPDGVSDIDKAFDIAKELGQNLTAARVNDPMFGGIGEAVDPGVLLSPPEGKRARVSVISFVGLPSDEQRQSFVNQLQMALFAWVKRNPAGDRPLGGLFVMDEAQTLAPAGAMTACTRSTLSLVSQARKYGLGLVFATQAPKGLHNQIPGNATTQFFGLLNAPIQIDAAREMARAKGGDVPDISQLRSGQFYVALEGEPFRKVRTPLCLTHHPKSPLTTEEVLSRARAGDA